MQIHHKWRRMYVGECQGPGVRTDFEMVHLRKVPSQYTHLSGLLDIFKTKIVSGELMSQIGYVEPRECLRGFTVYIVFVL